ncbi:MAG: XkdX family protein [Clostridiales bacterium]|nr:XkdX family protein [Clostridiales bacterium]
MSKKYNIVKNYYDRGLWPASRVGSAVVKGWITAEEYEEITEEVYTI